MSHLPFSERDIEQLLEGNVPPGRGDLVDLARMFARVRAGVEGAPVPPMDARLLAELDADELSSRLQTELERAADRRRVQRGRRRWRAVAAAAAVLVIGGAVVASLRGPLGDDLRTRPGDDPVSVAEPDGNTPTTLPGDVGSGAGNVETDDDSTTFSDAEDGEETGDLGVADGSSSGVVTSEAPTTTEAPPTTEQPAASDGEIDWDEVAEDCHGDRECIIDAAVDECRDAGVGCWEQAADACNRDAGCRGMMSNMCGDSWECREAVWGGPSGDHGR